MTMKKQRVLIKKLSEHAKVPTYGRNGDVGFDFYASEDVFIEPGQTHKVPTGIAFQVPAGHEIQLRPRSGISADHKLRIPNAPGTVDTNFRGEVMIIVENTTYEGEEYVSEVSTIDGKKVTTSARYQKGTYIIRRGDRVAQGVLNEVPQAVFEEVDEIDNTERGASGFGSSGVQ